MAANKTLSPPPPALQYGWKNPTTPLKSSLTCAEDGVDLGGVLDPAFTFSQPSSNDVDDGSLRVDWLSVRSPDSPDSALLAIKSSLRCCVRLRTEPPIERPRSRKTCDELVAAIPARRSRTKVRIRAMVSADEMGWREEKDESSFQLRSGGGSLIAEHVCSSDF